MTKYLTSSWSLDYQLSFSLKSALVPTGDWIRILPGDKDLTEYLDSSLTHFIEKYERCLEDIKLIRSMINKIDKSSDTT